MDDRYAQTIFFDDFSSSQLANWGKEENWIRDHTINIWVNNSNTISVSNSNLNLTMLYSKDYTVTSDGIVFKADYISGEVYSLSKFRYGVFECKAKFASQLGSFPSFWCFGQDNQIPLCSKTASEIDFVELKADHISSTLDIGIFYHHNENCTANADHHGFLETAYTWGNYDTFKCVWSPEKVCYYVNGNLLETVWKDGGDWYPKDSIRVILSQQVTSTSDIVAPQTSYFDYVKVKQFFLAPEITCPTLICSTSTATMNVDSAATNISWSLTPSSFFTIASDTGKTVNIVRANGANGKGKITYTFQMPSGESFIAEKDVWVGEPAYPLFEVIEPVECNFLYVVKNENNESVTWSVTPPLRIVGPNVGYRCTFEATESGYAWVTATAENDCGSVFTEQEVYADCFDYLLSPNPASAEVIVSIESGSARQSLSANVMVEVEYNVRILNNIGTVFYNEKMRGDRFNLSISNLKDGNYIVEVKSDKKSKSKQLVVKH